MRSKLKSALRHDDDVTCPYCLLLNTLIWGNFCLNICQSGCAGNIQLYIDIWRSSGNMKCKIYEWSQPNSFQSRYGLNSTLLCLIMWTYPIPVFQFVSRTFPQPKTNDVTFILYYIKGRWTWIILRFKHKTYCIKHNIKYE